MSDTNRVRLSIARTAQRGGSGVAAEPVNPANFSPAGQLFQLRYTGTPGLGSQPNSVVSNEIRSDRQTTDSILVGTEAGGNTEIEFSAETFNELVAAALFTNFKTTNNVIWVADNNAADGWEVNVADQLDFAGTANTVFTQATLLDEMLVRIVVPAENIDEVFRVTSVAANIVTVTNFSGTSTLGTGLDYTGAYAAPVGFSSGLAGDLSIALDTPQVGQSTITFANEAAAAWAGYFPDVAGTAYTTPVAGMWLKLAGMEDSVQNAYARMVSVTATTVVIETPLGFTATAQTTTDWQVYIGDFIRNPVLEAGATPSNIGEFVPDSINANSFLIERRYTDHSPITREVITGNALNALNLTFEPQSVMTGSIEFFGFKSNVSDDSPNYADIYTTLPTDIEQTTTDVLNTSTNVGFITFQGTNLLSQNVATAKNLPLSVQLNIGNTLRRRNAVGVFGAASIGSGRIAIGGNINTYFDDKTLLEDILLNARAQYVVSVSDGSGKGVLFDVPSLKFTGGAPDVPGIDQDAVLNPPYQGLLDPVLGYTIHLTKWNFVQ